MRLTPSPLCARGTPLLNRDKPADSAVHTGSSTRNAGQAARENGALLNNEVGGWGVTPPLKFFILLGPPWHGGGGGSP